jgi:hypothetical protein
MTGCFAFTRSVPTWVSRPQRLTVARLDECGLHRFELDTFTGSVLTPGTDGCDRDLSQGRSGEV